MSFVEVFPVDPVIATTRVPPPSCARQRARERLQRRRADRAVREHRAAVTGCERAAAACVGSDEHAPGAGRQRVRRRRRRRRAGSPARPDEQIARADARANRSDARVGHPGPSAGAAQPPAAAREPRARRPVLIRAAASRPAAASASRATVDVVERKLAPAGELLALLVALAGDDHDVAGRGRAPTARAAIASAAVGEWSSRPVASACRRDLGDDRLGILRARVVGGHDHDVGQPRGDLAHQRALAAVAVAAGAEHADHAAAVAGRRRSSSRAAASTFSSESGVCA